MKQKLLTLITALSLSLFPLILSATPAAADCSGNNAAGQVLQGIGQTGSDCTGSGVTNILATVVNILSIVVGAVAVVMVIISGFKYVTSGGSAEQVGSAKSTLIYALIGLIIAALAQFLVHFVLFRSNQATLPPCPADHSIKPPDCHT